MDKVIQFNATGLTLTDILTFSTRYMENLPDMWFKIKELASKQPAEGVQITFMRANGTQHTETARILNIQDSEKRFDFGRYVDDGNDEQVFSGRTIRLDNVMGEVPVLLGFSYSTIFCFGKKIDAYRDFMEQIKQADFHNEYVRLTYLNTNNSLSQIECLIKKANKSNFETVDYRETLSGVAGGVGVALKGQNGKDDVHRFVSGNGFLVKIEPISKPTYSHFDDGEVFGQTG